MNLCIFASDLSVITGHNKWHTPDEITLKIWSRNYPEDFERVKTLWEKQKNKSTDSIFLTAEEYIEKSSKKNNLNLESLMTKCLNSQNVSELGTNKKKVLKQIEKSAVSATEKKILKECVENTTNTNFGTKKEKSVIKKIKKINDHVSTPGQFYTRPVLSTPKHQWIIGGRVDGMIEDDTLIEIKNRIYKLFYRLRDYEKIQIYAYLYILGITKAKLVENIARKTTNDQGEEIEDEKDTNIIEIDFSIPYWQKTIIPKIRSFVRDFESFLKSDEKKMELISEFSASNAGSDL